jgi:hypothetical protein
MSTITRFNADGTKRVYTHLNGIPIDEYWRMKNKQYCKPHPRHQPIKRTTQQIHHVQQLRQQGHSLKSIATELGVSIWQVRQSLSNAPSTHTEPTN